VAIIFDYVSMRIADTWSINRGIEMKRIRFHSRQNFRALAFEPLENRLLLSITSHITIINNSGSTLTFASENFDNDAHDLTPRPSTILNNTTAGWDVGGGSGVAGGPVGVIGSTTWNIGNTAIQDSFNLDFPLVGVNHASQTLNPDTNKFVTHEFWSGNDPTFTLTLNAAANSFLLNSSSWTEIDRGAIFTTQTPVDSNGASPPTVSGRVTGLAVDPTTRTIYAATAGGGVWKDLSNSSGTNPDSPAGNSSGDWVPLTDSLTDSAGQPIPLFMGAIAVAPSNPKVIYAGTGESNNSGDSFWGEGILVSQDGGQTWALTGQGALLRTAISKIVIDPQDPNTAWVAVSNTARNGNSAAATGIFRTTNGLASLTPGQTTTWSNTVAAAANTSAGNNANGQPTIKDTTDPWSDVVIDPTTTTKNGGKATLYAAVGNSGGSASNGVFQSTDSGSTWYPVRGAVAGLAGGGRIALAISHPAANASATMYVAIANPGSGNVQAFDVSFDGGGTWTQQNSASGNPANFSNFPNYMTTLGWYGNDVQADPNTPTTVYAAGAGNGTTIAESTDGGATWTDLTTGSVNPHADNHAMAIDGVGRLVIGNDGGVWRLDSNNLPSFGWENLNGWETQNAAGLSINQITGIALSPAGSQVILTASQDNGTNIFKGGQGGTFDSAWTNVAGNDGGFVRIDPTNTNPSNPITGFTEYQYPLPNPVPAGGTLNSFQRLDNLTNPPVTPTNISGGIGTADGSNFYAPYVFDPNNSQRLVLGTNKLYVTTDQGGGSGGDWTTLGTPIPGGRAVGCIAIAPTDSTTIYVGTTGSGDGKIFVSKDSGSTWTDITPAIPFAGAFRFSSGGLFQGIFVSPTDANTAYAVTSAFTTGDVGRVWQLTSKDGKSWTSTDFTGTGLPTVPQSPGPGVLGVPINSILFLPAENTFVVGTDVGVYFTNKVAGGATVWSRLATGFPNVQVTDLQTRSYPDTGGDMLAAGTHGRGLWETQFVTLISLNPTNGDLRIKGSSVGGNFTLQLKAGDASTLQAYQGTSLLGEFPVNSVKQIHVDGLAGTNTLALNFNNGNLIPSGSIAFDGGKSVNATLVLNGQLPSGPFANEVSTPTGPHAGAVILDGSTITYTNLKPIIDTVSATSFTIKGTPSPEQINIVNDPNGTENGFQATEVNCASFEKVDFANKANVTVDGLDGADTFMVNNPNSATGLNTLAVATGPTAGSVINVPATPAAVSTIINGNAAVTVNVGSLAPAAGGTLDPIKGHLTISDSAGAAVLNVDDTGSLSNRTGTLTANTLTGLGMASGITYSGLAAVNIALGRGSSQLTIAGTHTGTTNVQCGDGDHASTTINIQSNDGTTTVNGNGRDVVNVGSLAPLLGGVATGVRAPLLVNGVRGMDILNVDDTGSVLPETAVLSAASLTGLGMAHGITYNGFAALAVLLGAGNNNFTILDTHAGSTVVAGGAGNDTFNVEAVSGNTSISGGNGNDGFIVGSISAITARTIQTIKAPLLLDGGSGNNSVAVSADADLKLSDTSIQISNGETIGIRSIRQAALTGGPSDNAFDVSGWTGAATLIGGGGLDKVVSSVDADAVLSDTSMTRSNGASFVLNGIGQAVFSGGAGNNTLDATGFSGPAWLYGGAGNDNLLAGSGNDYLDGGTGSDTMVGGAGADFLIGVSGSGDTITAGTGNTRIYGSAFADIIHGGPGDDLIYGGGNDYIDAGAGNDTIVGGSGSATIYGGAGNDLIFDGGASTIYADGPSSGNANDVDRTASTPARETILFTIRAARTSLPGAGQERKSITCPPGASRCRTRASCQLRRTGRPR
jgi:hypothetical protein